MINPNPMLKILSSILGLFKSPEVEYLPEGTLVQFVEKYHVIITPLGDAPEVSAILGRNNVDYFVVTLDNCLEIAYYVRYMPAHIKPVKPAEN